LIIPRPDRSSSRNLRFTEACLQPTSDLAGRVERDERVWEAEEADIVLESELLGELNHAHVKTLVYL
jgi:hypothetical protein